MLHNMANVRCRQRRYDEAIALFERALELIKRAYGGDSIQYGETLLAFAACLNDANMRLSDALEYVDLAIAMLHLSTDGAHPKFLLALEVKEEIEKKQKCQFSR